MLSSRPDTVMGDTALVRVVPSPSVPASDVRLDAGGADATPPCARCAWPTAPPPWRAWSPGCPGGTPS
ncbi:hypothetical protein HFP72_00290 [Nocardiopsis sp. ARC36]